MLFIRRTSQVDNKSYNKGKGIMIKITHNDIHTQELPRTSQVDNKSYNKGKGI